MIALTLLLGLLAPSTTVSMTEMGPVKLGQAAPWFAGWSLDDTVLNRTRLLEPPPARAKTPPPVAQKGVALVFFATWCAPCVEGMRAIATHRDRLAAAGVRVVLVNFREEGPVVRRYLVKQGLPSAHVLLDKFGRTAAAFGVSDATTARLPRTVVLDNAGVIRGLFAAEGPDYIDRIIGALADQTVRRTGGR